jgi:hypothetical protein
MKKYKYKPEHLLLFIGCLLLLYALCTAERHEKPSAGQTTSESFDSKKSNGENPVNPFREGMIRAAETSPFTCTSRIINNLRSFIRVPVGNTCQSFSFENVILIYSVHKKSLNRIFIRKHASSTSLFLYSSCRYYVFALREIIV